VKFPRSGQQNLSVAYEHVEDFAGLISLTSDRDPDDMARFSLLLTDGLSIMAHMARVTRDIEVLDPATHQEEIKMDSLVRFLIEGLSHRALFSTSGQYIGFAPKMVLPGDKPVRFAGLEVPFILRQITETEDFQLIGQCYVYGEIRTAIQFHWEEERVEFKWFSLVRRLYLMRSQYTKLPKESNRA